MTPTALFLVILAAFVHASWNILLKNVRGGLSFIWFVDILQGIVFAPWIVWILWFERPLLGWAEWVCIVGSAVIHIAYYFFLQRGYRLGDISLVYPIARGSGPMLSSMIAILFLQERPGVLGVFGIIAIGVGIFFLAGGLRWNSNANMRAAIFAGLLTGVTIACYTVWDKYAVSVVRVSSDTPGSSGESCPSHLADAGALGPTSRLSSLLAEKQVRAVRGNNSESIFLHPHPYSVDRRASQPDRSHPRS